MACKSHPCFGTPISGNYEKFHLNEFNSTNNLLVSIIHNQPFIYRDESGQVQGGIEYKLIKTIAEKLQLTLTFLDPDKIIDDRQNLHMYIRYNSIE